MRKRDERRNLTFKDLKSAPSPPTFAADLNLRNHYFDSPSLQQPILHLHGVL